MNFYLQDFILQLSVTRLANIHYFEFTNEYHTTLDSHDFYELIFIDKGSLNISADNFKGTLSQHQLIIHSPNEVHSLSTDNSIAPNVVIIGFECMSNILRPLSSNPITLRDEHIKRLSSVLAEGFSLYEPPYDIPNTTSMKKREDFPFGADQMIRNEFESFLITIVRDFLQEESQAQPQINTSLNGNMQAIHQYLTENYNTNITLDNLCFIFGTNKTSLCRDFKKSYGMTIVEYVHEKRIQKAKNLLRQNDLSVTEISYMLGFVSVHYFCRLFNKLVGLSPTMYQKSIKSKLSL
jgi:AraC-like DNA-binding protein